MAIIREIFFALIVLLLFLFFGKHILFYLNISTPALSIAGGIVLFIVAIRMIFPHQYGSMHNSTDADPWVVPLAIPLVAGPSSIAYIMTVAAREPDRILDWVLATVIACVLCGAVIYAVDFFRPWIKDRALTLMERIMGMILVIISVQMLMNGVTEYSHTFL